MKRFAPQPSFLRPWMAILGLCLVLPFVSCKSAIVEAQLVNRTDSPLRLIEVNYPSASFGVGTLEPGAIYNYRLKVQGSGTLHLRYSDPQGSAHQFIGPNLSEGQSGSLLISIDRMDSVSWKPSLSFRK